MGTGCSSQSYSRRVAIFHRKISKSESSRYEWSISEMRPISSHANNNNHLATASTNFTQLTPTGLTLGEAHLLRIMWPSNSIEQSYELGLEIFEEIFRLEPEVMEYFGCLRTNKPASSTDPHPDQVDQIAQSQCPVTAASLRGVGEIQSQIIRFVSLLTLCVKYCDQPQNLDERLFNLGRRHRIYVPHAQMKHFRVFEKALTMVMRRRAEQQGIEEYEDTDSGYSAGTTSQATWHPSSPMDRTQTNRFRNPKEQVKATIAWTSLAAYVGKQIWNGFVSEHDYAESDKKNGT